MMQTTLIVQARVDLIASVGDDEKAHTLEDALYKDLLVSISMGLCINPAACAKVALKTQALKFSRWTS